MFRRLFDFFVFTSLFIACCAVLMVYQTSLLFNVQLPLSLYAFVFAGSVCSYNFHWYLTPPNIHEPTHKIRWNLSNRTLHLILFIAGLAAAGICCFLLMEHWLWLALTAFFTFMYSAPLINHPVTIMLRKVAIGKTIFLAFAWTHVTTLLPLLITVTDLEPQHTWFVINRFFFIYAICIVFDRRDIERDKEMGVRSLITYLSPSGVDGLFWASQIVVLFTFFILAKWFLPLHLVLLLIPALIMGLLYSYSKKNLSDYLYYFLLDGLMALSAPMLILAKFAR